ncbi:MAG: GNAT family N-acetyltransferase [Candidatus Ranarchaeia archaeon]
MEFRVLKNEKEELDFFRMSRQAWEPEKNTYDDIDLEKEKYRFPLQWQYGVFSKNDLLSAAVVMPMDQMINDTWLKSGGIANVVTKPEYRNKGMSKKLLLSLFKQMYEDGTVFSTLYPFKTSFYEKLGYAMSEEGVIYQFEVEQIKDFEVKNRSFKEVYEITDDIKQVYNKVSSKYNLLVKRNDFQWKIKKMGNYRYVCYDENKKPVGYVLLRFLKNVPYQSLIVDRPKTISVYELFWLDKETKKAIFSFLKTYRDQRKYFTFKYPVGENIIDYLETPFIRGRILHTMAMSRIIDVKKVLESIQYPLDDFVLTIKVFDNQCEWNNKTFEINSTNKKTVVKETKVNNPDLEISINHLTQLVLGFKTTEELREMEFIKISYKKRIVFNKIFPKKDTFLRDFY